MAIHQPLSPEEAGDRLAIRELIDAYSHCADRRDAEGQMSLFTVDAHFVVDGRKCGHTIARVSQSGGAEAHFRPPEYVHSNDSFQWTESTVTLDGELSVVEGRRTLMIASICYLDTISKVEAGLRGVIGSVDE